MYRFLFLFLFSYSFNSEVVDGLLAVVDKHVILKSDVIQQVQMEAAQKGVDFNTTPLLFEKMYQTTLENMVNQYIVLVYAEKDTNVYVSNDEIEQTLDQQIDDFVFRAGSVENLETMMGKNIKEIRREYWVEVKNMLMINQFKYFITANVDITRQEVFKFYSEYKDSLPTSPPSYSYSVVNLPVLVGDKTKKSVFSFLEGLKDSIVVDDDFKRLAILHSDDPGTAALGGDLGFTTRGSLVPEYEKAAYSLGVGVVSDPIVSPFGVHLIQVVGRAGEKVHTRHILKQLVPSEEDFSVGVGQIKEVYSVVGDDFFAFDSLASLYALDGHGSGVFNDIPINNIPDYVLQKLSTLDSGQTSEPFLVGDHLFSIVRLNKKVDAKKITPEHAWFELELYAKNYKLNNFFVDWIDKKRPSVYIKYY